VIMLILVMMKMILAAIEILSEQAFTQKKQKAPLKPPLTYRSLVNPKY
jgi:hypothetical protein